MTLLTFLCELLCALGQTTLALALGLVVRLCGRLDGVGADLLVGCARVLPLLRASCRADSFL